jgi:hypothetical protein
MRWLTYSLIAFWLYSAGYKGFATPDCRRTRRLRSVEKGSTGAVDLAQSVRTVIVPRASPNKAVDPAAGAAAGHCQRSAAWLARGVNGPCRL